jgi:hypothetical protein
VLSARIHAGRAALALACVLTVAAALTCGGGAEEGAGAGKPPTKTKVMQPRPRRPLLTRELAPELVTGPDTYDTQPALALDASARPWVAWVANTEEAGDVLLAAPRGAEEWDAPEQITPEPGMYLRPLLVASGDELVAIWTATGAETGIWSARRSADGWSAPERATPDGHHLNPEACVGADGRVWMAWQAQTGAGFDLYLAHDDGAGWSEPQRLTEHPGNDWDPSLVCDSAGTVWITWSAFRDFDYDLYLASFADGELSAARRLTDHAAYDLHPAVAVDAKDRLWIAWDRVLIPDHGSSGKVVEVDGRVLNRPPPEAVKPELALLCVDAGERFTPEQAPLIGPVTHHVTNSAFPRVVADDVGGIWVVYRAWTFKHESPRVFWWDVAVTRYTGSGWSAVEILPYSDGNLEEPSIAANGASVWIAAEMEHRRTAPDDSLHPEDGPDSYIYSHRWPYLPQGLNGEVYVSRLGAGPTAPAPVVRPAPALSSEPGPLAASAQLREAVRHEVEYEGETLQVLFGDTHRHSNVSRCKAGRDATVIDAHRFAIDVHRYDFHVVSDHSNHTSDFNWWSIQKLVDLYYMPGVLSTLHGYEISNGYPTGHKNVVFPGRPSKLIRQGMDAAISGPEIWRTLGGEEAITIPHTPAFRSGTDWEDHDPEYERLVEIFQSRTGSSEHLDAPRVHELSRNRAGFVHAALNKGYRLGIIASTDHGFGASYAVVFARGNTRADVYEALHERRCYGTTAYGIVLDVRADGHLMGEEFTASKGIELHIDARAYAPLENVVVFADGEVVREWKAAELGSPTAQLSWTELDPPAEAEDARWYYVRVQLADGELAWSSPLWVHYVTPQ